MHKNSRYALATTYGELKMDRGFINQEEELRQCFPDLDYQRYWGQTLGRPSSPG